jgi:argininosuccinate lyase
MTLWSGRVGTGLAPEVEALLRADDAELFFYDIEATRTHAKRLVSAGLLSDDELREAERLLDGLTWEPGDEDVHTLIERRLGEVGRKIHAGRSRNDQVAAAFRLYVADACAEAIETVELFVRVILDRAEQEAETPLPGYTHLQRAQPVTVGHHLLAWVEMLDRDRARLRFACAQAAPSPLGAAALAGSTLPLPAPEGETMRNSLDGVADRDFALDYLYACAMLASHLSRVGEELVLWSTSEFAFIRLPERAATGSSAMPQKLNPDVAELVRGKAGAALGRLAGLLATVKGLPLAYNRDLQEDKPPVFAARRDLRLSLDALVVLVGELTFDRGRLAAACSDPLLYATDAAEQLVTEGVPFREAHERVAASVRAGTFEPPAAPGARGAPGPGGVTAALEDARRRFG